MIRSEFLLPFVVGLATVVQAGINRRMSTEWGLSWAIMLNNVILVAITGVCLYLGLWSGKPSLSSFRYWYLIPAVCGFTIVMGMPLAIAKIGALNSFLLVVGAQIIFSILWDKGFEGVSISWSRIGGAALVFVGAWIASRA